MTEIIKNSYSKINIYKYIKIIMNIKLKGKTYFWKFSRFSVGFTRI